MNRTTYSKADGDDLPESVVVIRVEKDGSIGRPFRYHCLRCGVNQRRLAKGTAFDGAWIHYSYYCEGPRMPIQT